MHTPNCICSWSISGYLVVNREIEEVIVAFELFVYEVDEHPLSVLVWNVADIDRRPWIAV